MTTIARAVLALGLGLGALACTDGNKAGEDGDRTGSTAGPGTAGAPQGAGTAAGGATGAATVPGDTLARPDSLAPADSLRQDSAAAPR